MPELSQSENAGANRRDRNLYSGQRGSTKREEDEEDEEEEDERVALFHA